MCSPSRAKWSSSANGRPPYRRMTSKAAVAAGESLVGDRDPRLLGGPDRAVDAGQHGPQASGSGSSRARHRPMNRVIVAATHRPLRLILVTHSRTAAPRACAALLGGPEPLRRRIDDALRRLAHADVDCVLLDLDLAEAPARPASSACSPASRGRRSSRSPAHDDDAARALIRAGAQDSSRATIRPRCRASVRTAVERHRTGERLEVERLVREVAADMRTSPPRPPAGRPSARRRRADRRVLRPARRRCTIPAASCCGRCSPPPL